MASSKPADADGNGKTAGMQRLIDLANQAKPLLQKMQPYLKTAYPYCVTAKDGAVRAYVVLEPYYNEEVGTIALAVVLLFFGGQFAYTIACWQVFRVSGQRLVSKSWAELCSSFEEAYQALQKDTEARAVFDKCPDGYIKPSALLVALKDLVIAEKEEDKALARRKVLLLMKCIDPSKIWDATLGVFTGLLSVLAALRSRFVQCITLGANVGRRVVEILTPRVKPQLYEAFPSHTKWVDFGLRTSGSIFGAMLSMLLVRAISGFNSALEGAHLLVPCLLKIAERKNMLGQTKLTVDQSRLAIGALTVVAFLSQLRSGFSLPWLLKLPLAPVLAVEYILGLLASQPLV